GIEFWGSSFVADPQGVVVAEASEDREEVLLAEIDPARIEDVRRNWPFLRDRRIDAYSGITRRFLDEEEVGEATDTSGRGEAPPAGGVGETRGHLDRLAAQRDRLARQVRPDPVGLRGDRPKARAGREGSRSGRIQRPRVLRAKGP